MNENITFDREKFKDAVHIVVQHVQDVFGHDALGKTKLHKILFYSDLAAYLTNGTPLTGEDYLRQKFGPTARHLSVTLNELARDGRIKIEDIDYFGFQKQQYSSTVSALSNRVSHGDRNTLLHMAGFVCGMTACEISEFSHDEVWASVPMGERIPYFAALAWHPVEVTDEELQMAAREAVTIAPLIALERRNGRIR